MADRKLEGPGSSERLTAVQRGFRRTTQRLNRRTRLQGWADLARVFALWFLGLALFALAVVFFADRMA